MKKLLTSLLEFLERRQLRRKVRWDACLWNPRDFRRRLNRWQTSKLIFETNMLQAISHAAMSMVSLGASQDEIRDFVEEETRKIKAHADQIPWRS